MIATDKANSINFTDDNIRPEINEYGNGVALFLEIHDVNVSAKVKFVMEIC